jgi:hypothetical protein
VRNARAVRKITSRRAAVGATLTRTPSAVMYEAINPYDYFRAARERLEYIGRHMKLKKSRGLRN